MKQESGRSVRRHMFIARCRVSELGSGWRDGELEVMVRHSG